MFNKQEKNLNFKKVIITILCSIFGLTCAGLFASVINSKGNEQPVLNVENSVGEIKGEILTLNWSNESLDKTDVIKPASVTVENPTGYDFVNTDSLPDTLPAGTEINVTYGSENGHEVIYIEFKTDSDSSVTVEMIAQNGYKIETVKFGYQTGDTFTGVIEYNKVTNRSLTFDIEDIDPYYSGTIAIQGTTTTIAYYLNLYSDISNGVYSAANYGVSSKYTVDGSADISKDKEIPRKNYDKSDLIREDKVFLGWMISTYNLKHYYDSVYTFGDDGTFWICANDRSLELEFTIDKIMPDAEHSGYSYYQVSTVKGYGTLNQTTAHEKNNGIAPIVIARWANKYNVKIDNSGATNHSVVYWTGFTETKEDLTLFGVGGTNLDIVEATNTTVTFTIADDETYNFPFMSSHMNGNHYGFYKNGDYNSRVDGAWNEKQDMGYYVYNYGHEITAYYIKVDGEEKYFQWSGNGTTEGWNNSTTSSQGSVPIESLTNFKQTFQRLAQMLDDMYVGATTTPTIAIVPVWTAATVEAYLPVGYTSSNTTHKATTISFGKTYSNLQNILAAKRLDGQTLTSFYVNLDNKAGGGYEKQLIPFNGVWNYYKNLTKDHYAYVDDLASGTNYVYRLNGIANGENGLLCFNTNNIYKVMLTGAEKNKDGNYSLVEGSGYWFNSDIYASQDENVISFETPEYHTTYRLMDDYADRVRVSSESFVSDHNYLLGIIYFKWDEGCTVANNIFYPSGGLDGQDFWIYLVNSYLTGSLPQFEAPYKKQLAWENSSQTFVTSQYNEEVTHCTTVGNSKRLDGLKSLLNSSGTKVATRWSYSSSNITLEATYGYTLDLYYENQSGTYSSVPSYVYNVTNIYGEYDLDIKFEDYIGYTPIESASDKALRKSIVGWTLNLDNARDFGYTVYEEWDDASCLKTIIISDGNNNEWKMLNLGFYIESDRISWSGKYSGKIAIINVTPDSYVSSIPFKFNTSCTTENRGKFVQDPAKPIIMPLYETTYLFTIDNSNNTMIAAVNAERLDGNYGSPWLNSGSYNVEDVLGINPEEYYGAGYVWDIDDDFETVTLEVSKDSAFPFPENSGYAFKTKAEIEEMASYSYVYNYGYTVSGWCVYITGKNTDGQYANYSLSFSSNGFGYPIDIELTYIPNPPIGIMYTGVETIANYGLNLGYIASNVDSIASEKNLIGDISVSLIPKWTPAEIHISYQDNEGSIFEEQTSVLFANEYDISEDVGLFDSYVGQSVVAFQNNESVIVQKGLWQYINLTYNYVYDGYDEYFNRIDYYIITLTPKTANNLYRVDFENFPYTERYDFAVGDKCILASIYAPGYTLSSEIEEEVKSFSYDYSSKPFMANGIKNFSDALDDWEDALKNGTDINLYKLMYNPTQIYYYNEDGNTYDFVACEGFSVSIYLPYGHAFKKDLPSFVSDSEKTIFWVDNALCPYGENIAYASSSWDERYVNEVYYEDGRYYDMWNSLALAVDPFTNESRELPIKLNPYNAYSMDMYYSTDYEDGFGTIYDCLNTASVDTTNGWFAPNTTLELQDKDEKELYVPEAKGINGGFEFKTWILDLNTNWALYTERFEIVEKTSEYIKLRGKGTQTGKEFIFYIASVNAYNSDIYYLSGYKGNGIFEQDIDYPLLYAAWSKLYDITIDNTNTYWSGKVEDSTLYGAASSDEITTDGFAIAHLTIGDNTSKYNYPFMSSIANDANGQFAISFFKPNVIDGNSIEKPEYSAESQGGGWYFVYNYGYYISGWIIQSGPNYFIYDTEWKLAEDDGSINWNVTSIIVLNDLYDNNGNFAGFASFARNADDYFVNRQGEVNGITFMPVWTAVGINVQDENNNNVYNGNFADAPYTLSSVKVPPIGQSLYAYELGENSNKLIALHGNWNYMNIEQAYSSTASVAIGQYLFNTNDYNNYGYVSYSLVVTPVYLDNIYRVNLTNIIKNGDSYVLADNAVTDYTFFNDTFDSFTSIGNNILTFDDYLNPFSFTLDLSVYTLIDDGIGELLNQYFVYNEAIDGDGSNDIAWLNNVFIYNPNSNQYISNSTNTLAWDENVNPKAPQFFIYLANNQQTGRLPVFDTNYFSLIYWENTAINDSTNKNYVYPTELYDANLHGAELVYANGNAIYSFHADGEGNFTHVWQYSDGYDTETRNVTFEAFYFRENYILDIHTLLDGTDQRRGYVRVDITDTLYAQDKSITNTGGSYIILYNGTDSIEIFNAVDLSLVDDSGNERYNTGDGLIEPLVLYAGCDVVLTVYDQSKDAKAMQTGFFDEMIGYKFSQKIDGTVQENGTEVNKDFLFASTTGSYVYTASADDIASHDYVNKATIHVNVYFENIIYNLKVVIDNNNAGKFSVYARSAYPSSLVNSYDLNNMYVQDFGTGYAIEYYAYAGFTLETNAFVYDNGMITDTVLHNYNSTADGQKYHITHNVNDAIFYGTWLREYYYSSYTDYAIERIDLGKIEIRTEAIEFNFGLKVYESDISGNYSFVETRDDFNLKFKLNESTATNLTPKLNVFLANDLGFWYYNAVDGTDYALISSRLFFVNNPSGTTDNYYTTYPFLITTTPENTFEVGTAKIGNMVKNYDAGVIISPEDGNRNIYLMIEVKKLFKLDMKVASLEYDTNSTTRSTTFTTSQNNIKAITVIPNAPVQSIAAVANTSGTISGYYFTDNGTTTVTVYTYDGLANTLSSTYDTKRYSAVEYCLGGGTPLTGTFTVDSDNEIIIKYIPKSLGVEIVYNLNGAEVLASEVASYINDTNIYKPTEYAVYYPNDYVAYMVECTHEDYDIRVLINGTIKGTTSGTTETAVKCIVYDYIDADGETTSIDNRYLVTDADFDYGIITIKVEMVEKDAAQINIDFTITANSTSYDTYGTFKVVENGRVVQDASGNSDFESITMGVVEGRDIYVKLNLSAGYDYVGIKYATYSMEKIIPDAEGKILIIGDFDPLTQAGQYQIILSKKKITAILNTDDVVSDYYINGKTYLDNLFVESEVSLSNVEIPEEKYYCFYYTYSNGTEDVKAYLTDDGTQTGNALTSVRITSAMLARIGGTTVNFGVVTEARYKLSIEVAGDEYLAIDGLKLLLEDGTEYVNETYVDSGTKILLTAKTIIEGKYLITLINKTGEPYEVVISEVFVIDSYEITMDNNYIYMLEIIPDVYTINVEEYAYETVNDIDNTTPTLVDVGNHVNNASQLVVGGQNYNAQSKLEFTRTIVGDRELSAIYITGNDFEDIIAIEFTSGGYKVYKIVGSIQSPTIKEEITLSSYNLSLSLTTSTGMLTYITQNDINIRFDYKLYKSVNL